MRKKEKYSALPDSKPVLRTLDLSGKSRRKKPPYQPHQAFSIIYWRPKDSPLRREVEDLWARRNEDSVHEMLKPFLNDAVKSSTSTSEKLLFHMAVMRWKYSLLNLDERTALHNWIAEQRTSKGTARALPWSEEAVEHGDDLFAENVHIQKCVFWFICREKVLTLYSTVALTTSHPQYRWLLRKLSDKQAGRRWSSLAASSREWEEYLAICKSPN